MTTESTPDTLPSTTSDSVVIIDEWEGRMFFADFRDASDVTITPFHNLSGCMWTTKPENATLFSSDEEARKALAARGFPALKRLRVMPASACIGRSRPPLP